MRAVMKRRWLRFGGLALAVAVLLVVAYYGMSWVIVDEALVAEAKPFEQTPEELGLSYEDVEFQPREWDEITLRGWLFPNPDAAATIVLVHGLDGTRGGDLELVRDLLAEGFAALTFDLRGHGESDKAQMGAGIHEQDDVLGAVDFLVTQRGVEPGRVFLLGHSYGAAIALMAGFRHPSVAGVYADSAFASLTDLLVKEVSDRTPVPRWAAVLLEPGMIRAGRWFKGIDIADVRPEAAVSRYPYILGLAHCTSDKRIPFDHVVRLRRAAPQGSYFNAYRGCGHTEGYEEYPRQYVQIVAGYFDERLSE